MLSRSTLFVLVCGSIAGCDAQGGQPPVDRAPDAGIVADGPAGLGCKFSLAPDCPSPVPTYDDVAPIFEERCVPCHGERPGNWPLDSYRHIADWKAEIRAMVFDCSMPPPESGVAMLAEERIAILTWIRCGLLE